MDDFWLLLLLRVALWLVAHTETLVSLAARSSSTRTVAGELTAEEPSPARTPLRCEVMTMWLYFLRHHKDLKAQPTDIIALNAYPLDPFQLIFPLTGGSLSSLRGPLGGQVSGGGRPGPPLLGTAILRHRSESPAFHLRGHLRHWPHQVGLSQYLLLLLHYTCIIWWFNLVKCIKIVSYSVLIAAFLSVEEHSSKKHQLPFGSGRRRLMHRSPR